MMVTRLSPPLICPMGARIVKDRNMKKSSNSVRIGFAVAVILGTIGWLAFTSYGANKSYYVTVPELVKVGCNAYTSHVRVEGFVEPGSIQSEGAHVTFVLNEFESHNANAPKG